MADETQTELPVEGVGVAPIQIAEIDDAAAVYENARDKRQNATNKEVEAKEKLIALLHTHEATIGRAPDGAIRYKYKGKLVELVPTDEKLTVKKIPKEDLE